MAQNQTTDLNELGDSADQSVRLAASRAHRTVDGAAERAHHFVDGAAGKAASAVDSVVKTTSRITRAPQEWTDSVSETIRARPLRNIGLALLLGFVVGRLTSD